MHQALINPNFRAVPLAPITASSEPTQPTPLSCPSLPKRGCREYLRRMRKMLELNVSAGKAGNRAQRRAYAAELRFI